MDQSTDQSTGQLVARLAALHRAQRRTLATVESCTGGMVGAALTAMPGISDVYRGGVITYSDQIKHQIVGVRIQTIEAHGAVSAQVAIQMAQGGWAKLGTTNAIAITGIAGPDGATPEKPVGTVWICVAQSTGEYDCRRFVFPGGRAAVRNQAMIASMEMMIQQLEGNTKSLAYEYERFDA